MAFILTTKSGTTLLTPAGKHHTIPSSHVNYTKILDAIRERRWTDIDTLLDVKKEIEQAVQFKTDGLIRISVATGEVFFNERPLKPSFAKQLLALHEDNFDIRPYVRCLAKIEASKFDRARDYFANFMDRTITPINDEGNFILYKRVQDNYKSFYDGKTDNSIGSEPRLTEKEADPNPANTCSSGMHCCTHEYLPHYHGGQGKVVICEVDPRDIIAFVDEGSQGLKLRCLGYKIIGELGKEMQAKAEVEHALPQPAVTPETRYDVSTQFIAGYEHGYNMGRKRQDENDRIVSRWPAEKRAGYEAGHKDGRGHKPRLYRVAKSEMAASVWPWPVSND
jgi:hypothetical protein